MGGHVDSAFLEMARYSDFAQNNKCKKILQEKEEFDRFKECMRKKRRWQGKRPTPPGLIDYLNAFEPVYRLTKKEVIFKRLPEREHLVLFEKEGAKIKVPNWWDVYNNVKHDVGISLKDANLKNARDALAVAFLLNTLHIPGALRLLHFDILKPGISFESGGIEYQIPKPHVERFLKRHERFDGITSTSIFIYSYYQT